ncbi:hypothetical protein [Faecalispora jeddahensis]|uniref:hypothetical protein n=1 Tax=Faecalispora jeddahensis TaxID=1414721 RepID=UPI0018971BF8|nr:hypothetical protein [Faecalispora jeddahensis]
MRRFLALFLSLCIALSGSVAMAAESSEPNRLGGYVSIFDWIQGNKDTEYPGSGGGQAGGGGAQRFTTKADYDAYVAGLHKQTITKSDVLRAHPATNKMTASITDLADVYQLPYHNITSDTDYTLSVTDDQIAMIKFYSTITDGDVSFTIPFYFTVPVDGAYILSFSPGLIFATTPNTIRIGGPNGSTIFNNVVLTPDDNGMHMTQSFLFQHDVIYSFKLVHSGVKDTAWYQAAAFVNIIPDEYYFDDVFASVEDYGSRPSGYDGTLAVPGATTTYIDNSNVVNGDVTTLYDYSTNTTYNITNWTYDYGDRTYNLTLEDGSTAVVVYGDDGITVDKGAITTEYKYWLADDSGGGGSSSSPGGDSGGSWSGIADLLGKLLKGLFDFLGAILGAIFSALTSLLSVITGSLKGIVDGILAIFEQFPPLFLGFAQFLAAVFPYLPSEILSLLFFGIAAVVFVGLLRFFLNR